ncbi:MAG: VWA domain-containing protein [Desulfomonile tiedjei]|nr:VWA domain-containing protein [Desulfomonile tiedjei]
MTYRIPVLPIILFLLSVLPRQAVGGGILHVFPPTFQNETFAIARLSVLLSKTLITVSDSSVEYRIDQTFHNDNDFPLEGSFMMPLNGDGALSDVEVKVNGHAIPFQMVPAEAFFPELRAFTEGMKDPALLGLAGKNILLVRGVSVGIRKQCSVRVEFKRPLTIQSDLLELSLPLAGERYSLGPVGLVDIMVRFKMSRSVRSVFSPTHHISVEREAPHRCLVTALTAKKPARTDFTLIALLAGRDLDLRVLTHRSPGEKGAFMAFLEPPVLQPKENEPEKDVVLVLDASESLGKTNVELGKRALTLSLEKLRPADRFNVLVVRAKIARFAHRLVPATLENVREAVEFVNTASSEGGTDFYNGLMSALEQFSSRKRSCVVIVAGDGRGTVGVTNRENIIDDVTRRNRVRARVYTLAIGVSADVALLDRIAVSNKGICLHFSNKEDFGKIMRRLFAAVSPPRASGVSLGFRGLSAEDLSPEPIPDMSGSEGLVVFGRYEGKGDVQATVVLKARVRGKVTTVTRNVRFPEKEERHPYIPALWAMRRVARLLERDWLKGPEPEGRHQIARMAEVFGFKAPFQVVSGSDVPFPGLGQKDASALLWMFKTSNVVSEVEADRYRSVGDKVFRSDKGAWIDIRYRASIPTKTVKFLGDEYFALLKEIPGVGEYLAVGPQVTLLWNGGAIRIVVPPEPAGQ